MPLLSAAGGLKVNIVVVEPDPDLLELFGAVLGSAHQVRTVRRGDEAAALLAREPRPDVLLSELELAGESGESLAFRARAYPHGPAVFFMSVDRERLSEARDLARQVFLKPFALSTIVAAVENVAREKRGGSGDC
jgi:DNA-binding response OmpR family regulator